jgi:hypothetical protein
MSHTTIRKGIHELQSPDELKPSNRLRKPGGGRKKVEIKDPKVVEDLETIMDENLKTRVEHRGRPDNP